MDVACDAEELVEDVAWGALVSEAGAAVVPEVEDDVSLVETGATAGRFGIGDTWGAGAASAEDGG